MKLTGNSRFFQRNVLVLAGLFFIIALPGLALAQLKEIEIILDCSRSMLDPVEGGKKLDVAKTSIISVLGQIPSDTAVGFRVFSSTPVTGNVSESCKDSIQLVPIQTGSRQALMTRIMSLEGHGATPIGYSLQEAAKDFSEGGGVQRTIILVSDGAETCGLDPVAVVKGLRAQGIEIQIHAIGFDVDNVAAEQLRQLAEAAGGTYFSAGSAIQLEQTVSQATQAAVSGFVSRPKPQDLNLALPSNGCKVILASDPKLAQLFGGVEKGSYISVQRDSEVVVHFKDEKVFELNKAAVPIYKTEHGNLREFEILVSTESPTSGFVSIGVFETQNIAFIENPFQEFVFDPVRARYLKFKPRSFWGDGTWGYLYEFRVYGREASEEPPAEGASASSAGTFTAKKAIATGPTNIALRENGGSVVAASKGELGIIIDGKENEYVLCVPGDEAIVGFKDNQSAEITKVALPIFKTQNDNLRTFEIQVSPDSPTTGFVSVGTFEMQNIAFLGNPYQEFVFDPVRGRYLKIIVRSGYGGGGWAQLYELRVIGELIGEG